MANQRKPILPACRQGCWQTLLAISLVASWTPLLKSEPEQVKDPRERARQVLTQAIEAMGGDRYLGVKTEYVRMEDVGLTGNGHMMMLEENSAEIAEYIGGWLENNLD